MDVSDALRELGVEDDTGRDALVEAAREAWRRRHVNTVAGAAVLAELHHLGMSWREIAEATGIPPSTANRWGRRPEDDQEA